MLNALNMKLGGLIINVLPKSSFLISVERHLKTLFSELQEPLDKLHDFKAKIVGSFMVLFVAGCLIIVASNAGAIGFSYMLALITGISLLPYYELKKRIRERRFLIIKALPDFINRLELLIEAGMTLSRAFELAANSIEVDSPLSAEIIRTSSEIRNGASEITAYEQLAIRCRTVEVARLCGMIIQNLRKGNSELATLLRMVAGECWASRKAMARKKGEEASTGLIFPVMLQLLAVLIVTAGPAIASLFQNEVR